MKENNFIDSNILIYAHTTQDENKRIIAQKILSSDESIMVTTQVINESINVWIKRFKIPLISIQKIIDETFLYLPVKVTNQVTIREALKISEKYQYSYYDSLIIAAALQNECSVLYSEDLQHNQNIERTLTIINPFI